MGRGGGVCGSVSMPGCCGGSWGSVADMGWGEGRQVGGPEGGAQQWSGCREHQERRLEEEAGAQLMKASVPSS